MVDGKRKKVLSMAWNMAETIGTAITTSGFAKASRAHIEVSRDDERVTVFIEKDKTVVVIRLEPKAALELAIAIAKKARAITEETK